MTSSCKCHEHKPDTEIMPTVQTMSLANLSALSTKNTTALASRKIQVADAAATSEVHVTSDGGVFLSTGSVGNLQGSVVLSGTIGPFPIELHLTVKLEDETVTVTVELDKPIHLGPFTWTFKLGGVAKDAKGNVIGAQTISLSADTPAFNAAGFGSNFLCILKCAGLAILPILVGCLPSLSGGPQAFIACVVAKAGTGAAAIASCVVKCVTA